MLDNPNGSSEQELVDQMRANRTANDPDLPTATGGTEEAEANPDASTDEELEYSQEFDELESESEGNDPQELEEEQDAPTTYTVKVDGEELEVNVDELRSGYQRDKDYRKKTMDLAEQRKEFEAKDATLIAKLEELSSFIEQKDESIDWENLRDNDPSEYLKQKELQEQRKAVLAKENSERKVAAEDKAKAKQGEEIKMLMGAMGDKWDEKQQGKDFDGAYSYLSQIGLSRDEINSTLDHRIWQAFFDAAKYDRLRTAKTKVKKQVRDAPKSVKPGQRRTATSQTDFDKAAQTLRDGGKMNETDNVVALLRANRAKKGK